jgi:hypothetical protein
LFLQHVDPCVETHNIGVLSGNRNAGERRSMLCTALV